jgi:arabinofuranosyltransferase
MRWIVCSVFAAYLFVGLPFNQVAGHETYAFVAVAFLATVLAENRQAVLAGLILGLAATFRPDAVLLAPILLLLGWKRSQLGLRSYVVNRSFWHFCIGFATIIVPWLIYLWLHFGQLIPGTMDAKRAQVWLNYWPLYNPINLLKYLAGTGFSVLLVLSAGLLAVVWMATKLRDLSTLLNDRGIFIAITWFLFGLGSSCTYFLLNVTFWFWYGVPVLFSLGVVGFIGLRIIVEQVSMASVRLVPRKKLTNFLLASPVIIFGLVSLGASADFFSWYGSTNINPHIHAYEEVGRYLKRAEPSGTSIQMSEPGSFGFGLGPNFKIIDELGLITPGVAKALLKGDTNYAKRTYNAKYLVCSFKTLASGCLIPTLNDQYEFLGEADVDFWRPKVGHGALLYRRKN